MSCDFSSTGASEQEVLELLLAQERAALDPHYGESDPSQYVAMYADEVTAFDPWSNGKVEDTAARNHLLGFAGTIPPFDYEIANPRVDLYGTTAVFTFNVDLVAPATGAVVVTWNSTEVHHRTGDGWELVHAHWSYATPPPEETGT